MVLRWSFSLWSPKVPYLIFSSKCHTCFIFFFCLWTSQEGVYQFAQGAIAKYPRLDEVNNWNLFSYNSGGWKSKTKVSVGSISAESSLPDLFYAIWKKITHRWSNNASNVAGVNPSWHRWVILVGKYFSYHWLQIHPLSPSLFNLISLVNYYNYFMVTPHLPYPFPASCTWWVKTWPTQSIFPCALHLQSKHDWKKRHKSYWHLVYDHKLQMSPQSCPEITIFLVYSFSYSFQCYTFFSLKFQNLLPFILSANDLTS